MSRQRGEGSESLLSILAGVIILLAGAAAVFYAAYKVSYVSVDYGIHVGIVEELDWRNPVQLLKEHPEPAWHLLVRAAMSLFGLEAKRAAGLVSGGLCALAYLMAAHFLYRAVGKGAITARDTAVNLSVKASAVSSPGSGSGLSLAGTAFFTLILSLSAAIFVPWFNEKPYLGQGSPNPWHNPTTIMVRPIALLIFVLVMGECLRVQRRLPQGTGTEDLEGNPDRDPVGALESVQAQLCADFLSCNFSPDVPVAFCIPLQEFPAGNAAPGLLSSFCRPDGNAVSVCFLRDH